MTRRSALTLALAPLSPLLAPLVAWWPLKKEARLETSQDRALRLGFFNDDGTPRPCGRVRFYRSGRCPGLTVTAMGEPIWTYVGAVARDEEA